MAGVKFILSFVFIRDEGSHGSKAPSLDNHMAVEQGTGLQFVLNHMFLLCVEVKKYIHPNY